MVTLHDIELRKYKNVNYIKPDSGPIPASNLDDIYDSNDDEKSVFSTLPLLPKHHTSILPAHKDEDKDIKIPLPPELSKPKQSTAKFIDYHKLANPWANSQ